MPDYIRTPKPAASWDTYDLEAFNIEIVAEPDVQAFFGVSVLPVPQHISPVIWNDAEAPAGTLSKTEKTFFAYIEDALSTPPGEQTLVSDLALYLLDLFDYDAGRNRVLQSQEEMWLPMCGSKVLVKTDGAVMERVGRHLYYTLLVQEDTSQHMNGGCDAEAQLVAQAIAAFRWNNRARGLDGLPALDSQTFPALMMFCTAPSFYFVTITKALAEAVQLGTYPQESTIIHKFLSSVLSDAEMMNSVQDRRTMFQYLEAFKQTLPPEIEEIEALTQATIPLAPTEGPHHHTIVDVSNPRCDTLPAALTRLAISGGQALPPGNNVAITVGVDNDPLSSTSGASVFGGSLASSGVVRPMETGSTFSPGPVFPRVSANSETFWTARDLQTFNIKIIAEHDMEVFFGVPDLPMPQNIPPVIWDNVCAPAGPLSKTEKLFFAYMENALLDTTGETCRAVDFVRFLLQLFGYDDNPDCVLHSQKDMWFDILVSDVYVKTDVFVAERLGGLLYYSLLVQADMQHCGEEPCDPEAQLVAQAIAAFRSNNWVLNELRQPILDSHTFAGIVMTRTTPTFFLITIKQALSFAVCNGICPKETTTIRKFGPPVDLTDPTGDGMLSLQNRKLLFGYLEAFKQCLPLSPPEVAVSSDCPWDSTLLGSDC